jgi:hypothetical protein
MEKKALILIGLILAFSTQGCDLFRPIGFPPRPVPGDMPSQVVFRGHTETFNQRYYFALRDGALWAKQFAGSFGAESGWICFGTTDNPYRTLLGIFYLARVDEVSVDGGYIVLRSCNRVYWTLDGTKEISAMTWFDRWGVPFGAGSGLSFPSQLSAWSASYSDAGFQKYYTDRNNIRFTIFVGHLFLLDTNRTDIHFADGWLPRDWGYRVGSPLRDRFKAVNMSVSGSVIFLIGRYGDMFTCHNDFDVAGANPMLRYTYETITVPDYAAIYNYEYPRRLPHEDWVMQPKIAGDVTSRISISSNGEGQTARLLRVQGRNTIGETGYFEKGVTDASWSFVTTNEIINAADYIDNQPSDMSASDENPQREYDYKGALSGDVSVSVTGYNFYSSPGTIVFTSAGGASVSMTFHHHIYFRLNTQADIGSPGSPLVEKGAIAMPANIADLQFLGPLYDLYLRVKAENADTHFIPVDIKASTSELRLTLGSYASFDLVLSRQ